MNDNLSPIKKVALQLLDKIKEQVINDCDEEQVVETMAKCHPSMLTDYINPDDYCNAEKQWKYYILGVIVLNSLNY